MVAVSEGTTKGFLRVIGAEESIFLDLTGLSCTDFSSSCYYLKRADKGGIHKGLEFLVYSGDLLDSVVFIRDEIVGL